jgi:8-oxo-dGTP pyrophosphatase MutT (NUDIX family)
MDQRWKPHVTVAAIAEREGRFLMVDETDGGRRVINQPAGHLEPGESLLEAIAREVREETGRSFVADSLIGIYQWHDAQHDRSWLRFTFTGEVGPRDAKQPIDDVIIAPIWMDYRQIQAAVTRHRSPMVMACLDDYRRGQRHSLNCLQRLVGIDD